MSVTMWNPQMSPRSSKDGILKISVPKAAPKELPKHTTITIE